MGPQYPWIRGVLKRLAYFNNILLIPMFTVIVLETVAGEEKHGAAAFQTVNLWFCGFFLAEWVLGLIVTNHRRAYLVSPEKVMDLVSSIPFGYLFQGLRVARLVRVLRVIRLIIRARRFRGRGDRLFRVFGVVAATVFAGALGLLIVEPEAVSGLGEALWWSIVTVSTVGYGDISPTTGLGRIVASLLVFVGIGVFGYVAGFMTSMMEDPSEDRKEDDVLAALARIEARLDAMTDRGSIEPEAGAGA